MKSLLTILVLLLSFISCTDFNERTAKEAVREYLKQKRVYDYTEREWGEIDSLFTPIRLNQSYNFVKLSIKKDISEYEYIISELNFNKSKNKERIKILRDSITLLIDSLSSINIKYNDILSERKNNRIGIPLILTYKTSMGLEKTAKYIFVFNENEMTVGHHLDEYGNLIE